MWKLSVLLDFTGDSDKLKKNFPAVIAAAGRTSIFWVLCMSPIVAFLALGLQLAIFLYSVILHEVSHGWVAKRCGDDTAMRLGRLTLNPIRHIDPIMTIIMPIFTYFSFGIAFGGAKPVPINPSNFKKLNSGIRKVSLAGVTVNVLLAGFFSLLVRIPGLSDLLIAVFGFSMIINLVLAMFNLMPIPPLDGSRFLRTFFPQTLREMFDRLDYFGIFIVLGILVIGPMLHLDIFHGMLTALIFILKNVFFFKDADISHLFTAINEFSKTIVEIFK